MTMNKREAMRLNEQENRLLSLGFTSDEASKLRRISMTLRRWYELECGTDIGNVSRSIERDEVTDKPFMRIQYPWNSMTGTIWVDRKVPVADREKGAINRLNTIISNRNQRALNGIPESNDWVNQTFNLVVTPYLQTDPRGAALYIIRPDDIPEGKDISAYYSRGLCVC